MICDISATTSVSAVAVHLNHLRITSCLRVDIMTWTPDQLSACKLCYNSCRSIRPVTKRHTETSYPAF